MSLENGRYTTGEANKGGHFAAWEEKLPSAELLTFRSLR